MNTTPADFVTNHNPNDLPVAPPIAPPVPLPFFDPDADYAADLARLQAARAAQRRAETLAHYRGVCAIAAFQTTPHNLANDADGAATRAMKMGTALATRIADAEAADLAALELPSLESVGLRR